MQQRQLRLGDILDDYCPRERRVTNHAIVAMVGQDVKQTRCTTCDAEHEYKHAKVPRQRRKPAAPAVLYLQALGNNAPKRVAHEAPPDTPEAVRASNGFSPTPPSEPTPAAPAAEELAATADRVEQSEPALLLDEDEQAAETADAEEEGPVHRPLIRATLPRPEGQPPSVRPAPEFTIRQPGGRSSRFRPRHQRQHQPFHGTRSTGNVAGGRPVGSGMSRHGGRPPAASRLAKRPHGRKRSK